MGSTDRHWSDVTACTSSTRARKLAKCRCTVACTVRIVAIRYPTCRLSLVVAGPERCHCRVVARGSCMATHRSARVSLRSGAGRRSRFIALDGRTGRVAKPVTAGGDKDSRQARTPWQRPDGTCRLFGECVHGNATDDRYGNDRGARQQPEYRHHAESWQLPGRRN